MVDRRAEWRLRNVRDRLRALPARRRFAADDRAVTKLNIHPCDGRDDEATDQATHPPFLLAGVPKTTRKCSERSVGARQSSLEPTSATTGHACASVRKRLRAVGMSPTGKESDHVGRVSDSDPLSHVPLGVSRQTGTREAVSRAPGFTQGRSRAALRQTLLLLRQREPSTPNPFD